MNVMVVGGGGREHAIIKKLKENQSIETIYALQMCIRDRTGAAHQIGERQAAWDAFGLCKGAYAGQF